MNNIVRIGLYSGTASMYRVNQVIAALHLAGIRTRIVPVIWNDQRNDVIDVFITSAAELPATLHEQLEILAITPRKNFAEAVVAPAPVSLRQKNIRVAAFHWRTAGFLNHLYPQARVQLFSRHEPVLQQLKKAQLDAVVMPGCDVLALGLDTWIQERLETSYLTPPAGQGCTALLCHKKFAFGWKATLQQLLHHEWSANCVRAEYAFLKALPVNSRSYTFAYAHEEGKLITLKAGVIDPSGQQLIKIKQTASPENARELGEKVALEVLHYGGEEILSEIRQFT
jgi:hydroxymethylbilane synthase